MSYTASYIVNSSSAQGTTDFQFTFPYIKEEHIEVYLNYSKITQGSGSAQYQVITNVSPKLIRLNTGTASANLRVEVRRNSSLGSPLVDYADGSTLTANDLDTSALQSLYIDQELKDNQGKTVSVDEATGLPSMGESSAGNLRLTKVADPTAAQDAATKNYVDTKVFTSAQIQDGTITSADIADGAIVNADVNTSAAIAGSKLQASTSSNAGSMSAADKAKIDGIETGATADQTNAEIRTAVEAATDSNVFTDADHTKLNAIEDNATADQTNAEIRTAVEAATDSNVFTDADHTKLNGIETGATADQTAAEIKTAYESNTQTNPLTDAEKAVIDGVTANTSELNKLDGVTASTTELNIVAGKSFKTSSGTLDTTSDTEIPSSKVIAAHVASSQTAIGGFTTIADEVSFPNTQPATGVVVSINNAAGVVINGSGVSTTGRRLDNTTVTINGFPSSLNGETLAAGVGLIVVSTSTANTYSYHKILSSETDVKQLSDDINDFNSRYRIASSAPGSNNDEGDLYFDTAANKMKVYNGSAWDDVASVGSFFVNTLSSSSSTGGGSATFNGSAYRFTLSNPGTSAQQHIVSVNGVIQKPNSGTSQPSEGFALSGNDIIFSAAPASGSDFFIITSGSSVSIGTPSANSVNSSHIIDGSIVNGDISNSAAIASTKLAEIPGSKVADDSITEVKLDIHNAPTGTDKFLKYTANGMEWAVDNNTVYTHPNHSGEVTSSADGAQTIADDVVDEANLKISNAGTNGQYLQKQSGNTGGLTWADVTIPPAGNTLSLVADGAIAAGKGVIIKSNGKAEQIKEQLAALGTPTNNEGNERVGTSNDTNYVASCWNAATERYYTFFTDNLGDLHVKGHSIFGSDDWISNTSNCTNTLEIEDNETKAIACVYDPDTERVIVGYRQNNDYVTCVIIESGDTLTAGAKNTIHTSSTRHPAMCYDTTNNKVVYACMDGGNSDRGTMYVGTVTGGSTNTISVGSQVAFTSVETKYIQLAFDENAGKVVVWAQVSDPGNSHTRAGMVMVGTVSGTSISVDYTNRLNFGNDHSIGKLSYNPHHQKTLLVYLDNYTNNAYRDACVISISGTTASKGTAVTGSSLGKDNLYGNYGVTYDPATQKHVVMFENEDNQVLQFNQLTISGTDVSLGNNIAAGTTAGNHGNFTFRFSDTPNGGASYTKNGQHLFIFRQSNNSNRSYVINAKMANASSNATATNVIGFAPSAISDGATGTINCEGNNVDNQSGLTAGTRYYLKNDGTLATSAESTQAGGLAISSSKLLIRTTSETA